VTYRYRHHQQYFSDSKNPYGYCNHGPNGLTCEIEQPRVDLWGRRDRGPHPTVQRGHN
jgi:hypothetical protein